MSDNLFETQYDLKKKSKLRQFYESKKILIYSLIFILIFIIGIAIYYQENKEKKKIILSQNYIQAKVYLQKGRKADAVEILRNLVFSNDPSYSTLSFFMILNENLISDNEEVSKLFDHLLENNKYDKEIENLLIYKKALYKSNHVDDSKLLEEIKTLLNNEESVWRVHALFLLGDFYYSRKEYKKAKDFYMQILSIKNLQKDLYDQARLKLILISND